MGSDRTPLSTHDVVVIGTSAGGVEALRIIAGGLPRDFPAAVFVVIHVSPLGVSRLPEVLSRAGPLKAVEAKDGEPIVRGRVYLARPDFHLLVEAGHVHVVHGPRENHWRPAVDPLFRSAALVYGPRAIGVVLTGALDDGSAGLYDVKRRGGIAVVQDPSDAEFPGMPWSALRYVDADHVVPLRKLAPLLSRLVRLPSEADHNFAVPQGMKIEAGIAALEGNTMDNMNKIGAPSGFTCPECFGPLRRLQGAEIPRFRCHVGHAYSPECLMEAQGALTEDSLYRVLQSNDERLQLMREMVARARRDRLERVALRWEDQIRGLESLSNLIRGTLASTGGYAPDKDALKVAAGNGKRRARKLKKTS